MPAHFLEIDSDRPQCVGIQSPGAALSDDRDDASSDRRALDSKVREKLGSYSGPVRNTEQQVLGANVAVAQVARFGLCAYDGGAGRSGEALEH
jgi:hypothetical protein